MKLTVLRMYSKLVTKNTYIYKVSVNMVNLHVDWNLTDIKLRMGLFGVSSECLNAMKLYRVRAGNLD